MTHAELMRHALSGTPQKCTRADKPHLLHLFDRLKNRRGRNQQNHPLRCVGSMPLERSRHHRLPVAFWRRRTLNRHCPRSPQTTIKAARNVLKMAQEESSLQVFLSRTLRRLMLDNDTKHSSR